MNVKPKHPTVRLNIALAVALIVGAVVVCKANAATQTGCQTASNIAFFNADYGLKPYLIGIGQPYWNGKNRLAATTNLPSTPFCDSIAQAAYLDQQRFYVLLRAFPVRPTRAQWKARYGTLMQTAINTDVLFEQINRGDPVIMRNLVVDLAWLRSATHAPFGSVAQ